MIRLARLFVHGIVKALLDREATEGTAQELSAVELRKRMDTLDALGTNVIRVFVLLIALVMILGELGLDIGPAIAGLGVVGIAVGFGAQSLVRDYLNGRADPDREPVQQGRRRDDRRRQRARSRTSRLRRTTLRDLDGIVHTVPNGEIKVASNLTRVWARINQDVTVAYGTDIDKAIGVVNEVGREMAADPAWRRRLLEAPHVERVEALGEYGVTLKILGLVRATEQWAAGGELRKRLLAAFATHGIEIPRPQRVVLARDPNVDPFQQGGATLAGPDPGRPLGRNRLTIERPGPNGRG